MIIKRTKILEERIYNAQNVRIVMNVRNDKNDKNVMNVRNDNDVMNVKDDNNDRNGNNVNHVRNVNHSPLPLLKLKEAPPELSASASPCKEGGDLLSRIAVQYHRRARA